MSLQITHLTPVPGNPNQFQTGNVTWDFSGVTESNLRLRLIQSLNEGVKLSTTTGTAYGTVLSDLQSGGPRTISVTTSVSQFTNNRPQSELQTTPGGARGYASWVDGNGQTNLESTPPSTWTGLRMWINPAMEGPNNPVQTPYPTVFGTFWHEAVHFTKGGHYTSTGAQNENFNNQMTALRNQGPTTIHDPVTNQTVPISPMYSGGPETSYYANNSGHHTVVTNAAGERVILSTDRPDGTNKRSEFDVNNEKTWFRRETITDASGNRDIVTEYRRDGTDKVVDYDNRSDKPWTRTETFIDANNRPTVRTEYNDDLTRKVTNYDADGTKPWSRVEKVYDRENRLDHSTQYQDAGDRVVEDFDQNQNQNWTKITSTYDPSGNLDYRTTQFDSGATRQLDVDTRNEHPWREFEINKAPDGRIENTITRLDNGKRVEQFNDLNNQNWRTLTKEFNSQNQQVLETRIYDDDARSVIQYDTANEQFRTVRTEYNPQGTFVSREAINDDNSRELTVTGSHLGNSTVTTSTFRPDGSLAEQQILNSDGTAIVGSIEPNGTGWGVMHQPTGWDQALIYTGAQAGQGWQAVGSPVPGGAPAGGWEPWWVQDVATGIVHGGWRNIETNQHLDAGVFPSVGAFENLVRQVLHDVWW